MPGLQLTSAQAQRLWGLDEVTCRQVLQLLVDAGFLYQPRHEVYMRRADHGANRSRGRTVNEAVDRANLKEAI